MFRSISVAVLAAFLAVGATAAEPRFGYGRTPSAAEIAGWDIDVDARGRGLPPGKGGAKDGEALYVAHCAACHGDFGEGAGRYPAVAGGKGTLASDEPQRTVGSFWPYAPPLFDYIRRTMPFQAPGSLGADEVYAIVAYVLALNDLVAEDAVLDAATLARIKMPNRDGFIAEDPRPDVRNEPCMKNCRSGPVRVLSTPPKGD